MPRECCAPNLGADLWGDINVGHIDTGVQRHQIFGDWVMIDRGVNYMEPGQPPIDPLKSASFGGHGTRTLSILTGSAADFKGVAPGLPVVPYRVCDDVILGTKEELNNVARAIRHAIEVNLCEVITISLGYPLVNSLWHNALGDAIDFAYDRGIIVVGAGGQFIDSPCYPGKFFRAICVGGYRLKEYPDDIKIYQEYGTKGRMRAWVDIWGPAKPVWRMGCGRDNAGQVVFTPGFGDGTSFATPHVSAAAAMWLSYRRQELLDSYDKPWQRVEAFRYLLQTACEIAERLSRLQRHVAECQPREEGRYRPEAGRPGRRPQARSLLQVDLPAKSKLKFESRLAREQSL